MRTEVIIETRQVGDTYAGEAFRADVAEGPDWCKGFMRHGVSHQDAAFWLKGAIRFAAPDDTFDFVHVEA